MKARKKLDFSLDSRKTKRNIPLYGVDMGNKCGRILELFENLDLTLTIYLSRLKGVGLTQQSTKTVEIE